MAKYKMVTIDGVRVQEHIAVAAKVLGRSLPTGAVVHHINGNKKHNANTNLVICPSQAYHLLLHIRERALNEGGNPEWRKCAYCAEWDDIVNMVAHKRTPPRVMLYRHRQCERDMWHLRGSRLRKERNARRMGN